MDLAKYLTKGVEHVISDAIRATLKNPAESLFLAKFIRSVKTANRLREQEEKKGEHIPAFLIASITSSCNLHCEGCYARANNICSDQDPFKQLTAQEWKRIFLEARDMGIRFILLAGGEPMLRRDVIDVASEIDDVVFPVFTNGTLVDNEYLEVFDRHRNILPVISIEGEQDITDRRRGCGIYRNIMYSLEQMCDKGIIFGTSVTVARDNLEEVISDEFIEQLHEKGCKVVIFVEYVPVCENTKSNALDENHRRILMSRLQLIREERKDMVFIAFPGDEKSSGGCLAAGRGFFHINSQGGAEPCPFAAYSDINVKDTSVREALKSGLFRELQNGDILKDDHEGGCVLFEKKAEVEKIIDSLENRIR